MTRRWKFLILLISLSLSACDGHDHDHNGHVDHSDSEAPVEVVTHFNEHTELFVEFPTLAVGAESAFAAHLTWLGNYRPVSEGKVSVILQGGGLPKESFSIGPASIPGIFRPVAVPVHAGQRQVIVKLESAKQNSVHMLGQFKVYQDKQAIPVSEEEDDNAISYLKEQQWQVDFAIELIHERTLRESIPAVATIRAAANHEAMLSAPHDGLLANKHGKTFPLVGDTVRKGDVLAVIGNRLGRELSEGISGSALRSPIDGTVAQMLAVPGTYLRQGDKVLHIVDNKILWLDIQIPEVDVPHIKKVSGAWLLLPGLDKPLRIETEGENRNGRVVAFGKVVDAVTRTAPLFLSFNNPDQMLRIGTYAEARVFTGHQSAGVAIPVSALVNDNGMDVVFVMKNGEAFERRVVQLGVRDGDYVEALTGVQTGERIVSRGAYLVKLAASGGDRAAHGHVH